jgi:tetratricopeptide (TPR) repeat protein
LDSERSLRISLHESEAWQARAEFWREVGNVAEALAAVNKADQLKPNNPELWSLRASLLELTNRFDDALQYYSRAVALAETAGTTAKVALNEALLRRSRLLRRLDRLGESQADLLRAKNIPARDPQAHPNLIDLTSRYNAALTENWLAPCYDVLKGGIRFPRASSDLSELPQGIMTLADVPFDVRGLIQVGAVASTGENYPTEVTDIPVGRACARLHFLHAAIFAADRPDGTRIGTYLIHYASGRKEEIPIFIGQSLADCFVQLNDDNKTFTIAWRGRSAESRRQGTTVRLFKSTWKNPAPTEAIHCIDFVFHPPGPAAPFLVAITAE